jgi:predicted metal-dependent hydrolase
VNSVAYTIRVSSSAKGARLRVSAREGLVVTIPEGFDEARVPEIVASKRAWVHEAERRIEAQRKFLQVGTEWHRPDTMTLRAIDQVWAVEYRQTTSERVAAVERPGQRLLVFGATDDSFLVQEALRRWLHRQAHQALEPMVRLVAELHEFSPRALAVRSQRKRWGSCSSRATISLNSRLMFLPDRLVRYVVLHELAHTVELNHSARFWATLAHAAPDYRERDAELREAWRLIPDWAWFGRKADDSTRRRT